MNPIHHLATYSDLANKIAVVTGGSRGIGAATARSLAACGAKVVVNGRDTNAINAVVSDIQSKGGQPIGSPLTAPTIPPLKVSEEQSSGNLAPSTYSLHSSAEASSVPVQQRK